MALVVIGALASHTLLATVHAHAEQLDSLLLIWALNRWQYGTYLTELCLVGIKFLLQLRIYDFGASLFHLTQLPFGVIPLPLLCS